eukprot:9481980-Pyramimonas_sp.AAC.1
MSSSSSALCHLPSAAAALTVWPPTGPCPALRSRPHVLLKPGPSFLDLLLLSCETCHVSATRLVCPTCNSACT